MVVVKSKLYVSGYCKNIAALTMKGEPWSVMKFPATCALIRHPSGRNILFDTGYATRFHTATSQWPFKFYSWFTPVTVSPDDELQAQLRIDGIAPEDVDTVILSHFHADHLCGLLDFPDAEIIASRKAFRSAQSMNAVKAVKTGYLPDLIPADFEKRLRPLESMPTVSISAILPGFTLGHDLFGDGSVIAVPLPGHAMYQFGVYFTDETQGETFLVADAAWSGRAIKENRKPSPLAYSAFDNRQDFDRVMAQLHHISKVRPEVKLVPSHCNEIWKEINNAANV